MKRLKIEPYKQLEKANLYSLRFTDKDVCETDEFISRFINDLLYQKDLTTIIYWLSKIGQESGALERYFRPEKGAKALPILSSRLRLYCIRVSDEILILGNGGIKTSQKVQDSPDAYPSFLTITKIEKMFKSRKINGKIIINGRDIIGDTDFDFEL